ncbi:Protein CBG23286 [Caenorhabditis briggsae]|nr:Protein CBG23286 [Caenorhabditis briggsae]CAP39718.2 Protein CBG23286 [Caenorhabditis briggsae]
MDKLTELVLNGQDEAADEEANGQLDWILAGIICIICVAFLVIAVKICYNYSKKFPETADKEHETIDNFNRRAISTKGTRGHVRYSVA